LELQSMRTVSLLAWFAVAVLAALGTPVSVFAQPAGAPGQQPAASPQVARLSIDEAVRLAVENNLGLTIARVDPLLEDINLTSVRTAWAPTFNTSFLTNSTVSPNTGFLSGASGNASTDKRVNTDVSVSQLLPWGGNYSVGWSSARSTTNNVFSNFSPQLRSSFSFSFSQPLLRNFRIDNTRQQLLTSLLQREIADVQLRQTLASTERNVRNAYWELVYARQFLEVQQQSLDLAQENLRNTRARIEIGTTPPIDEIEPEAEVAQREEAVITAQSAIAAAEDTLRTLIFDPADPDFWSIAIQPSDLPTFTPTVIDPEAAIRNALDRRSDLEQSRVALEQSDISIEYLRNQTLPEVTADFDYSVSGVGGTQLIRSGQIGGDVIDQNQRSFGSVIGDLVTNDFPTWNARVTIRYPLGQSPQQASLARARLQYNRTLTQVRQQEMQVALQVRDVSRQVQTNQQRIGVTQQAREFAERRLDAEVRKLAAGTSTNYLVLQAQRDLAQARNTELSAIIDYQRSLVDLATVQEIPLGGGGAVAAVQ
jgi:outer membrane protein TolC